MEELYSHIISAFHSLWQMKRRGQSIEIITPYSTCTDKFVSVFLTKRGDEYVVTDGAWIDNGSYDSYMPMDDALFVRMYEFYASEYGIGSKVGRGNVFHYKKTADIDFLPNIVDELARFISDTVTASRMNLANPREQETRSSFTKKANGFIKEAFADDFQSGFTLDQMPGVRFSAKIERKGRLTLVNYVTGSHPAYYISSLGKSSLGFDLLETQSINAFVENRVLLLDSSAKAYNDSRVQPYIGLMSSKTDRVVIPWSHRTDIKRIILN